MFIFSAETWRLTIDPFSELWRADSGASGAAARDTEMLEYSCNGEVRNAASNMSLVGGQATLQTPMAPMAPDKDLRQQDLSDHDSSDMIRSSLTYSVVDEVIPCYCS